MRIPLLYSWTNVPLNGSTPSFPCKSSPTFWRNRPRKKRQTLPCFEYHHETTSLICSSHLSHQVSDFMHFGLGHNATISRSAPTPPVQHPLCKYTLGLWKNIAYRTQFMTAIQISTHNGEKPQIWTKASVEDSKVWFLIRPLGGAILLPLQPLYNT